MLNFLNLKSKPIHLFYGVAYSLTILWACGFMPNSEKNLELNLFKVQSVTAVKFKNRGQTEPFAAVDRLKNLDRN